MLQSTILYKVSDPGGVPLDRDGVPVNISGNRQAVAILSGINPPDESLFEVIATFQIGAMFAGVKTFRLDPSCEGAILRVVPYRVDVSNGPQVLHVVSGSAWSVDPQQLAVFTPGSGEAGGYQIEAVGGAEQGQGEVVFRNDSGGEARVYIINLPGALWILEDGTWNNDGVWKADGIWKYQ